MQLLKFNTKERYVEYMKMGEWNSRDSSNLYMQGERTVKTMMMMMMIL